LHTCWLVVVIIVAIDCSWHSGEIAMLDVVSINIIIVVFDLVVVVVVVVVCRVACVFGVVVWISSLVFIHFAPVKKVIL